MRLNETIINFVDRNPF